MESDRKRRVAEALALLTELQGITSDGETTLESGVKATRKTTTRGAQFILATPDCRAKLMWLSVFDGDVLTRMDANVVAEMKDPVGAPKEPEDFLLNIVGSLIRQGFEIPFAAATS